MRFLLSMHHHIRVNTQLNRSRTIKDIHTERKLITNYVTTEHSRGLMYYSVIPWHLELQS